MNSTKDVNKPNFFILGAAKCGTTLLYDLLNQHPDVCMSTSKEPLFFEAEYDKGLEYYWKKYFSNWKGETAVGEARHRNIYLPYIAKRIKENVPDPRLIIILRNPVDRAYSHWWHWYSFTLENASFEDAIYEDMKRIEKGINFENDNGPSIWAKHLDFEYGRNEYRTYIDSGYYSRQIRRYWKQFEVNQIKIIFLEDISRNLQSILSELWEFLGVNPSYKFIDYGPRNMAMSRMAMRVIRMVKFFGGRKMVDWLPWSFVNLGFKMLSKFGSKKAMTTTTRRELVEHYYEYNRELEKITSRDLRHWDS